MMVMVMTVLMLVSVIMCMCVFVGIFLYMGVQFRTSMETAAGQIFRFLYFPSIRLIRLARKPAPKPLSILTTLTPLAQEFSMDNNALKPPNEAP